MTADAKRRSLSHLSNGFFSAIISPSASAVIDRRYRLRGTSRDSAFLAFFYGANLR
jgi:hypothetical protein